VQGAKQRKDGRCVNHLRQFHKGRFGVAAKQAASNWIPGFTVRSCTSVAEQATVVQARREVVAMRRISMVRLVATTPA